MISSPIFLVSSYKSNYRSIIYLYFYLQNLIMETNTYVLLLKGQYIAILQHHLINEIAEKKILAISRKSHLKDVYGYCTNCL